MYLIITNHLTSLILIDLIIIDISELIKDITIEITDITNQNNNTMISDLVFIHVMK